TFNASNGATVGFVTELNATGSAFVYSTYLEGVANGGVFGEGIAVNSSGNAYITSETLASDFPTTSNAYQSTLHSSNGNAFVTKFNASRTLAYSTYLGGSTGDDGYSIAVDSLGQAYVAGDTLSPDFPTVAAIQPKYGGSEDCFVTRFAPSGSSLGYSTFLGGS